MRKLLLATATLVAAAAVPTLPAQAQSSTASAFVGVPSHGGAGVRVHHGFGDGHGDRHHRDGQFNDGAAIGTWYDGGAWALYNNRSWEADSYNDWWHDRPDRAFPRWVQNGKCEQLWWHGDTLRC
jgi:hypothetical protein